MKRAQSIIMVLVMLCVMVTMGLSVSVLSVYEMRMSRAFLMSQKARYAAEAGVAFAKALLAQKTGSIDTLDDPVFTAARYELRTPHGSLAGSFALDVADEAGKIDLNSFTTRYKGLFDLSSAASSFGFTQTGSLGEDLLVVEQAAGVLASRDARRISDRFTVYSYEPEDSLTGKRRKVAARLPTPAVVRLFLDSGVYYTKALTWADAADEDAAASETYVHRAVLATGAGSGGSFAQSGDYRRGKAGGSATQWRIDLNGIERGKYYVFFLGKEDEPVGTVSFVDVEGTLEESVYSGEGLSRQAMLGEALTFTVTPPKDRDGYVRAVELVSLSERKGLTKRLARGVESIRINEIYANPTLRVSVTGEDAPGGTWVWSGAAFRSKPQGEKGTWVFSVPRSGYYYVKVFAQNEGGLVGDVSVGNERLSHAYHGAWTKRPVFVNKMLTVSVTNDTLAAEASLSGIELSQEPDGEFVELINVSDAAVDVSGFALDARRDGAGVLGWPAKIPAGTVIPPLGYAVLAVDADDASAPAHLRSNDLSYSVIWGESAKQLEFANTVAGSDDIVIDKGMLLLKDVQGRTVDAVEYDASQVAAFQSLERGDPTAEEDADSDGYSDRWYGSRALEKATPGRVNKNAGTQIIDPVTLEVAERDMATQQIKRLETKSVYALPRVPSTFAWSRCSLRDAAFLADKVTESELDLDLAENWTEGTFTRTGSSFLSDRAGQSGRWSFKDIPAGEYEFSFACDATALTGISVELETAGGRSRMGPIASQGGVLYLGTVRVGDDGALAVTLANVDGLPVTLQTAALYPAPYVRGRVNVNTADEDVLSLFFGTATESVVAGRPYGERDTRRLGIGDILTGTAGAALVGDLERTAKALCVRTRVFGVRSRGEVDGNPKASHEISTVIER
jgi:type II secretory pathway component PulK